MSVAQLSINPLEVLASHRESLETRLIHSVVPEVTDIELDPDHLAEVAESMGMGTFSTSGMLKTGPRNLLAGVKIKYVDQHAEITRLPASMSEEQVAAIREFADATAAVDAHFRELSGIPADVTLHPTINLIAGLFIGKKPTDTNRHFDFKGARPLVQYKMHFLGDPRYASLYYPGDYQRPTRFTQLARAFGGVPEPYYPRALFNERNGITHVMPSRVVVVEPWNAYHSGPTDKRARNTVRGIIDISYDLAKLPLAS